jgi:hypothetical protein
MKSAVKSVAESNTWKAIGRIGVVVGWLGVGFFISGVMNDLCKLAQDPMPYNPATLILAMFIISSIAIALFWFGKPIDRVIHLPTASSLRTQFVEAVTDDASMEGLQSETFD